MTRTAHTLLVESRAARRAVGDGAQSIYHQRFTLY